MKFNQTLFALVVTMFFSSFMATPAHAFGWFKAGDRVLNDCGFGPEPATVIDVRTDGSFRLKYDEWLNDETFGSVIHKTSLGVVRYQPVNSYKTWLGLPLLSTTYKIGDRVTTSCGFGSCAATITSLNGDGSALVRLDDSFWNISRGRGYKPLWTLSRLAPPAVASVSDGARGTVKRILNAIHISAAKKPDTDAAGQTSAL